MQPFLKSSYGLRCTDGRWQQIVNCNQTQSGPLDQRRLGGIARVWENVTVLLTLEERTELSRTFAKNRSVDDTQHGHITASGNRGQRKVDKSSDFLDIRPSES